MKKQRNILIIEDEQRAGEKLMDLIKEVQTDSAVSWMRSVQDSVDFLRREASNIDLIFSDIELLDGNSFEIFQRITPNCPIVFCTAYDQFYVDAFKTNGIAYLLKPYTKEQFEEAWKKYLLLFNNDTQGTISKDLIQGVQSLLAKQDRQFKNTFTVKKRSGVYLLKMQDVSYFQAQGDFVLAIDKGNNKHILNHSLSAVEEFVDPKKFFQINRSEIVSIDAILKYSPYTKNRLAITLSAPSIDLFTSNSRTPDFRIWVGEG